jgi:hypothetical protein
MVPFRAENTAAQGLGWSAVALMDNPLYVRPRHQERAANG